jgi:hypothetical protein
MTAMTSLTAISSDAAAGASLVPFLGSLGSSVGVQLTRSDLGLGGPVDPGTASPSHLRSARRSLQAMESSNELRDDRDEIGKCLASR